MIKFEWEKAIAYIEDHLARDLRLEEVARHCHYSSYHFSVLFHQYFGETMKSYIQKRRLTCAAEQIKQTSLPMIQIAMTFGYSSQEAFTRAFTHQFGITPGKYRSAQVPIGETYPKLPMLGNGKGSHSLNESINRLQDQVEASYPVRILHILNGSCMLETFRNNQLTRHHATYISFNEAMCWGETDPELFSQAFIDKRVQSLQTTEAGYRETVMVALRPLFEQTFDVIVLWFGDDMFCQMNLITILAYLAYIGYEGDVHFCMAQERLDEMLEDAFEINIHGYLDIYKSVLCHQQPPEADLMPVTYQAVSRYLSYREESSPIMSYIKKHVDDENLVYDLLARFPEYGLGDLQYEMLIAAHKNEQ